MEIIMKKKVVRLRDQQSLEFSRLVYNGFWFSPEVDFLLHSLSFPQQRVCGKVILSLFKGNVIVKGRESEEFSLYSSDLASMEREDGGDLSFSPIDSEGFIRSQSLRLRT